MKNANAKGFDKDHKQSSFSQFRNQDKGKKDARDGDVDEEKDLVESKFEKMDEQDDIHTTYAKLYKTKKLEAELFQVRAQLERTSSVKLDEMLGIYKSASDRIGLGYDFSSPNIASSSTIVFVSIANNVDSKNNDVKTVLAIENIDKVSILPLHSRIKGLPNRKVLPRASSSDSTPLHVSSHDEKARQDFSEKFSKCGIHSEHVILSDFFDTTLPTIIHSRGWESLCEILVSCPSMIIQEFYSNMYGVDSAMPQFITFVQGTRIVVIPELISDVLHDPRILHPNYPGCPHLRTVAKDELLSLFYETPLSWGDSENTHCSGFATGSRFLNMMMIFFLHPLSHYNSIIKPHASLLLSLIEDLIIDFPSHFILSLIDVYKDMVTRDKFIFPSAIMRIIRHSSVSYSESPHFTIIGAISAVFVRRSEAQF
ncbi:hypothetical protein SO802_019530 [Lithocarpus litseifolius]|uniref:Putative plant transposon protein domain-containing protein n=1 Tax=Lithocarpus litseifolius TaxID=425828 RepID=A0AAW2CP10_9ROSI